MLVHRDSARGFRAPSPRRKNHTPLRARAQSARAEKGLFRADINIMVILAPMRFTRLGRVENTHYVLARWGVCFFALLGYASRVTVAKRLTRVFRSCHASLDPKNGAHTTHASRARIHVRARPRLARAMPRGRSLRPRSVAQPRGSVGARTRAHVISRSCSFARARSQPYSLRQPRARGLAGARSFALGSLAGLSSRAGTLLMLGLAHPVRAPTFWGLARVSARGYRAPSPRAGTVGGSSPPCA